MVRPVTGGMFNVAAPFTQVPCSWNEIVVWLPALSIGTGSLGLLSGNVWLTNSALKNCTGWFTECTTPCRLPASWAIDEFACVLLVVMTTALKEPGLAFTVAMPAPVTGGLSVPVTG